MRKAIILGRVRCNLAVPKALFVAWQPHGRENFHKARAHYCETSAKIFLPILDCDSNFTERSNICHAKGVVGQHHNNWRKS